MLILYFILAKVIWSCNPLTNEKCLVLNRALNSELRGIDLVNYKVSGNVRFNKISEVWEMVLSKRFENPLIESTFSILYGKVECEMKAASGLGIISSFYLQSDDLDEIDVAEVFGNNIYEFQSNFFMKGNTTTWDRGEYHHLPNPLENFNKYTMEWTPHAIKWFINDQLVRTLDENNKYGIPKSPMQVKLSLWAGGDPDNSKGTIAWAGAISDYVGLPYIMLVKSLYVNDYSSGKYYTYGHEKGDWVKLNSVDGQIGGRINGQEGYIIQPEEYAPIPSTDRNLANGNQSDESDEDEDNSNQTEPIFADKRGTNELKNQLSALIRFSVWISIEILAFFLWF